MGFVFSVLHALGPGRALPPPGVPLLASPPGSPTHPFIFSQIHVFPNQCTIINCTKESPDHMGTLIIPRPSQPQTRHVQLLVIKKLLKLPCLPSGINLLFAPMCLCPLRMYFAYAIYIFSQIYPCKHKLQQRNSLKHTATVVS